MFQVQNNRSGFYAILGTVKNAFTMEKSFGKIQVIPQEKSFVYSRVETAIIFRVLLLPMKSHKLVILGIASSGYSVNWGPERKMESKELGE